MAEHAVERGRESGCPVHFVWDAAGAARWPVRLGFLALCVAGMALTAAGLLRSPSLRDAGAWLAAGAAVTWTAGQLLVLARRFFPAR